MTSIGQEAEEYKPQQTKNIADLNVVPKDTPIEERTFSFTDPEGETKEVTIKVISIDGEDYRVPAIVLKQLKEHIAANPALESFKVSKTGTGLNTAYTVIPLTGQEAVEVVRPTVPGTGNSASGAENSAPVPTA